MSSVVVRRLPRRPAPAIPAGDLAVGAPPEIPAVTGSRWSQLLTALPMLTGTLAAAMMFAGRQGGTYSYVVGGVFGVSSLGMLATSFGSLSGAPKKAEMMAARRDYLRHLAVLRERVRQTATAQREGLHYRHPDPASLWSTVDSYRLWERRHDDGDFGVVRVGLGPQTLATPLTPPVTQPLADLEPMTAGALRRFLDTYSVVPDLPVAVSVRGFARLYLSGPPDAARALIRALLAQLTVFHPPDDLLVAACVGPAQQEHWDYLKWLPHALHPTRHDALGPLRLVSSTGPELERLLDDVLGSRPRSRPGAAVDGPQIVVIVDGGDLTGSAHLTTDGGVAGVALLDLDGTPPRVLDRTTLALAIGADGALHSRAAEEAGEVGAADALDLPTAQALARQLAPLRLAAATGAGDTPLQSDPGLAELLGIADPDGFEPVTAWAPRPGRDRLRAPIGVAADGRPVELDLKESAQDGMGPHGLLIGATGSGKSELLRTLMLGLAATHDSESLNFVLVDFKGGATFASFDRLPHTAAVITNLADELPLVDRMTDALNGELIRRQELLRKSGNFASLRDYQRARAGGAALAPMPVLLLVCDEFSELLSAKPDFIDLFVQIGRLGRSLGVHLLLASQRLEEGRLRGLDTHLSYRIGLRTFSAMESRSVLGIPDAYELPRSPGHGFLKYGTEPLVRFKGAYVSGPYRRAGIRAPIAARSGSRILDYRVERSTPAVPDPGETALASRDGESLLDILVGRLAGAGAPAHRVWLPPLHRPAALDDLLGPLVTDAQLGLTVANPQLRGGLAVPVGLVDKPFEQRRDLLWLSLSGSAGHLAVVGGPQSGKSTLLRTVLCGLALTHTPQRVQFYCLDFGGGQLAGVRDLPHVGGVAGRLNQAAVRRTVGEVAALLVERERQEPTPPTGREDQAPAQRSDVFLVIDGWSTIRGEYDDLEPVITDLATRGLSYGIHVVATASRWIDFRPGIRDLFGARLELRLGDVADSLVSRRAAGNVPERCPGRGITPEGLHFLAALPKVADPGANASTGVGAGANAGTGDNAGANADTGGDAGLVDAVAAAWTGPQAPPVRLLPAVVPYGDIVDTGPGIPIGIAEADLRAVALDFAAEPHFLLFGDAGSGKSSFLRALATSISGRYPPEQARIIIVDYRRSLLGTVDPAHLIGYGTGAAQTAELVESVAGYMRGRLPGPDVTPQQLRERSWWTGPDCYLLVDDYDLVETGPSNPLHPLLDHLAQARDVGLHLVLARRSGGASRALYEPVIQRLRELSSPGLVLSGDREEGALLGTVRPGPLPPGRGWLITRREGVRLIQLAQLPPTL